MICHYENGSRVGSGAMSEVQVETRVCFTCTDYVLLAEEDDKREDTNNEDNEDADPDMIVRSAKRVLPISSLSHQLFTLDGSWQGGNVVDVSPDGIVRGICGVSLWKDNGRGNILKAGTVGYKFTVDASAAASVTAAVGNASPGWAVLTHALKYNEYGMGGVRGRMWYVSDYSPKGPNADSGSEDSERWYARVVEFE